MTSSHEEAFVQSFIVAAKKSRYLEFLANPRKRKDILRGLYHCRDLDPRYARAVPSADQGLQQLSRLLRSLGAGDRCHAISADPALDARDLPLHEALEQAVGSGGGTILSCVAGRLAYFEGEEPGDRWILQRG